MEHDNPRSGIYQILNTVNNKRYIGSSKKLYYRLKQHLSKLRKNKHHSQHLQNAWNQYGEQAFRIESLIECEEKDLEFYENLIVNSYKANDPNFGYNTRLVSRSNLGCITKQNTHRSGDKYNHLTLVESIRSLPDGQRLWKMLCDCGNYTEGRANSVKFGSKKSCGCHSKYSKFHKKAFGG